MLGSTTGNNPDKADNHARTPPAAMGPERPVLDDPLCAPEDKPDNGVDPFAGDETQKVVHGQNDQATGGEVTNSTPLLEPEPVDHAAAGPPESSSPYSPYFPHGIYEDALSVEKYYGRETPQPIYHPFENRTEDSDFHSIKPFQRVLLIVVAAVLILALILLAAAGGLALPFL
jgi:hypothetical protein